MRKIIRDLVIGIAGGIITAIILTITYKINLNNFSVLQISVFIFLLILLSLTAILSMHIIQYWKYGLKNINHQRNSEARAHFITRMINKVPEEGTILILGRSAIDWARNYHRLHKIMQSKKAIVKVGILDSSVPDPTGVDWSNDDLNLSKDLFKELLKSHKGFFELRLINIRLVHSYVAILSKNNKLITSAEEAGLSADSMERPYIEFVKDYPYQKKEFAYAENLHKIYERIFSNSNLFFSTKDTEQDIITNKIKTIFKKYSNTDILRGNWQSIFNLKSIEVFKYLYRYLYLRDNNEKKFPIKLYPSSIHFEITDYCHSNAISNCNHCDRWKWKYKDQIEIEMAKDIIDWMVNIGVKTITIGGGEPTTHQNFIEILTYAKEKGLEIGIITNGNFNLSDKDLKTILETCNWIRFSLDGVKPETIKMIRGRNMDYSHIETNIKGLLKLRKNYGHLFPKIGVNFVVQKHNHNEIEDFVTRMNELQIDAISFKLLHGTEKNHIQLNKENLHKLQGIFTRIANSINDKHVPNNAEQIQKLIDACEREDITQGKPISNFYNNNENFYCFAPFFFLTIDTKGDVFPCDYLLYDTRTDSENKKSAYSLGKYSEIIDDQHFLRKNGNNVADLFKVGFRSKKNSLGECVNCTRFCFFNKCFSELFTEYKTKRDKHNSEVDYYFKKSLNQLIPTKKKSWL